jgi:hypothetical protein
VRLEAERRDFAECREGQRVEHAPKVGIGTPPTPTALAERPPGNDDSKACVGRKQLDVVLWSRLGHGRHSDLPEAAHMWRLRISDLQRCRPALRVDLIVEGKHEQPTGPGLLGRPPLLGGPNEPGASQDAYQFYPYVCLPDHDDHSTFRRYVSLKPFGGEHSQRVLASVWQADMLSCSVSAPSAF